MSIPILQACKKRKRRPKIFSFHAFASPGCPIRSTTLFGDNVGLFLRECTMPEDYSLDGMPVWCTLLKHGNKSFVVPLYTVKENVEESSGSFCEHCRLAGWSNHFLSRRRYHMIIPIDGSWNKPLEPDALDLSNHLLHGLIHGNGFGHLICINGIEGGSKFLCGREIMDLWDRICSILNVRKITVQDVSKKRSMNLRLLYGVAYGHSWFGRWGYRFLRGSFGVKEKKYCKALELLSSLELEKIVEDFSDRKQSKEIKTIIRHYRDMSETTLITIRDLLKFILTVNCCVVLQNKLTVASSQPDLKPVDRLRVLSKKSPVKTKLARYRKFAAALSDMDSRWPARRLEQAAEVIVSALLEKRAEGSGHYGMTRQVLRDAARAHIGDTGLLDNVLKSMNNVIVGKYVVCRAVNPLTRILEYTVHELNSPKPTPAEQHGEIALPESFYQSTPVAGNDVYDELVYLYKNVLLNYPEKSDCLVGKAAKAVLDSKLFVKEWPFRDEDEHTLTFICRLLPSDLVIDDRESGTTNLPTGEIVSVPLHSTIRDLKLAVQAAFRDTYCIFDRLVVREIESLEEVEDEEVLFGLIESGTEVWIRGTEADSSMQFKYEGGAQNWKVRCTCGAQDDDGERMVACDICEVWQHTKCSGIEDRDSVPPLFVCSACCGSVVGSRSGGEDEVLEFEHSSITDEFTDFGLMLLPPDLDYLNEMELPYC